VWRPLKRGFELDTRLGYTTTTANVLRRRRFTELTEEEKGHILDNVESENTKRTTITAVTVFRVYMSSDFDNFSINELKKFLEMRAKKGEMYKKATLLSYRHGIQQKLEIKINF